MIFPRKVFKLLYLPVLVLILVMFLIINGWSAWQEGVLLSAGLVLGWFLVSAYLGLVKVPQLSLVFLSAVFQVGFLLFSFWLVISNQMLLASGIALGVNIFFVKELIVDYQAEDKMRLKTRLFNNINPSDRLVLTYLLVFVLLVVLLAFFVIY